MDVDGKIRAKLISIQKKLIPHLEVMQREPQSVDEVVQRDPSLSTANNLVDLATMLEIKNQILEFLKMNLDHDLAMIVQAHYFLLYKYGITTTLPQKP